MVWRSPEYPNMPRMSDDERYALAQQPLFTLEEVMQLLKTSRSNIYRLMESGQLERTTKQGKRVLFHRAAILKYLKSI